MEDFKIRDKVFGELVSISDIDRRILKGLSPGFKGVSFLAENLSWYLIDDEGISKVYEGSSSGDEVTFQHYIDKIIDKESSWVTLWMLRK